MPLASALLLTGAGALGLIHTVLVPLPMLPHDGILERSLDIGWSRGTTLFSHLPSSGAPRRLRLPGKIPELTNVHASFGFTPSLGAGIIRSHKSLLACRDTWHYSLLHSSIYSAAFLKCAGFSL